MNRILVAIAVVLGSLVAAGAESPNQSPCAGERHPQKLLWGNTRLDPGQAYRFARGVTVTSSTGQAVQLDRPLDFLVASDHAETMGVLPGGSGKRGRKRGRRQQALVRESR